MIASQRRFLNESTASIETPKQESRNSLVDPASVDQIKSNVDSAAIKKLNKEIDFLRSEKNTYRNQIDRLEEEVQDLNDELHSVQQKHKQDMNNLITQIDVSLTA